MGIKFETLMKGVFTTLSDTKQIGSPSIYLRTWNELTDDYINEGRMWTS